MKEQKAGLDSGIFSYRVGCDSDVCGRLAEKEENEDSKVRRIEGVPERFHRLGQRGHGRQFPGSACIARSTHLDLTHKLSSKVKHPLGR